MTIFYFLSAIWLVNRLKKQQVDMMLKLKWGRLFSMGTWAIIIGYLAVQFLLNDEAGGIIGSVFLGVLIYYLQQQPEFEPFKFYFWAHLPLVAVGLVVNIVALIIPDTYDAYEIYFVIPVLLAFVWIQARWNNSKKQRQEIMIANARNAELDNLVAKRTAELTQQKNELQHTVELLKATQAQLIQQEKLASLGELTAGIAHEIQNPLNFVNNFSEVSMELIDEMNEEFGKGDVEEAKAIASDIKQNLEKIIHHGKRADGIVKSMLQHSRASNGVKEPTDINALADEYLRLGYHGLRAKDKSFNADMATHFDPNLPQASILSQDVGRVLLNLFTNAFYATQQKQKQGIEGYKPMVEVSTSTENGFVVIKVKDNGTGIPDDVKDKILQPFFTTKPTGEGTGLGLSLSYDIIVKAHGGSLDIDTKENEYSEFTIRIPV